MQKLTEEMLVAHQSDEVESEYIPAIENAEYYFSLVSHNGKKILCILDDSDKWKPTTYAEMMNLAKK